MKKPGLFILLCVCVFVFAANPVFARKPKPIELEISSYDGFKLAATLNVPNYATIKNKAPMVIFLHSICRSQLDWEDFAKEIKDTLNVATLTVDLRGHGKSTRDKDNKKLHWQMLVDADFKKMPEDLIEVLNFIEKQYPKVDTERVAIVGSSLGATVGLMTASFQKKDSIKTVIMLSPMLEYKGFDLRLPIVDYGKHPLLFIVSEKDKFSYDSGKELFKFAQDKRQFKVYPFGGHGEDLLKFQPESKKLIIDWLKDSLMQGKIIPQDEEEEQQQSKFKYKEVEEYSGKIKMRGDIYGGVH